LISPSTGPKKKKKDKNDDALPGEDPTNPGNGQGPPARVEGRRD
jgi:hypothetical protein